MIQLSLELFVALYNCVKGYRVGEPLSGSVVLKINSKKVKFCMSHAMAIKTVSEYDLRGKAAVE